MIKLDNEVSGLLTELRGWVEACRLPTGKFSLIYFIIFLSLRMPGEDSVTGLCSGTLCRTKPPRWC